MNTWNSTEICGAEHLEVPVDIQLSAVDCFSKYREPVSVEKKER